MKTQIMTLVLFAFALMSIVSSAQAIVTGNCQGVAQPFGSSEGPRYQVSTSVAGDSLIIRLSNEETEYQATYQITNREMVPGYMAGFEFIDAAYLKGNMPVGFDSLFVRVVAPYRSDFHHQGSMSFKESLHGNSISGSVFMKCQVD